MSIRLKLSRLQCFLWAVVGAGLILGAMAPAGAVLVPLDSRFGPDTVLRDSETGLDWLTLPVPVAAGLSFSRMLAATEPGGSFADFRLADVRELSALLQSFGLDLNSTCQGSCFTVARDFVDLFGGRGGFVGPFDFDAGWEDAVGIFSFRVFIYPDEMEIMTDTQLGPLRLSSDVPVPFFLVSEPEPVSEPAGLSVPLAGLAGWMLWWARKRSQRPQV